MFLHNKTNKHLKCKLTILIFGSLQLLLKPKQRANLIQKPEGVVLLTHSAQNVRQLAIGGAPSLMMAKEIAA